MPNIIIPNNFKNKLQEGSFIYNLLENISKHLEKAPYFPEYTLHNEEHINAVLELANQLIPDTIRAKLASQAIEILIGAIALHDLGMFIHRAGLKRLIFGEHKDRCIKYLDKISWNDAWQGFYSKVQRYTDRQLINLFGDITLVEKLPKDDVPNEDTKYQRLLYGEFIRENHHRLAFDITQIGFPGDNIEFDLFKNCNCSEDTKVIIGIVARSHGMKLRDTEEYLKNYILTPPDDIVPVIYLMTVLRIADYLHLGESRASKLSELTDEMHSPKSKHQFHLNQKILNKPSVNLNTKSIHIIANPDCSTIYYDIERLLLEIQQELDLCWAILAEKYSYEYELTIHRVKSNLFDENKKIEFNKRFLTNIVTLGANPDIVKLLIEPLYGNNPSYGVRELIQNAVDSCNERKELDDNIQGKIIIDVDINNRIFTITDNGMGMNDDILRNYYLIAGSSFRYSDSWREKYINNDGQSKFARSGRFGIGVLACFLIGDEITVTTRHVNDLLGLNFSYSIEPRNLDVKKINADIGTKIIIKIGDGSLQYFSLIKEMGEDSYWNDYEHKNVPTWYQWFYFSKPEINYIYNGKQIRKPQIIIPDQDVDINGWYNINSTIFSNIKLGLGREYKDFLFLVNGIEVMNRYNNKKEFNTTEYGYNIDIPSISIIDKNNDLKINLNRTNIIDFPEWSLIAESVFKYELANLLLFPEKDINRIVFNHFNCKEIAVYNNGYTLCRPSFIYHTKQKKAILLFFNELNDGNNILNNLDVPIAINSYQYIPDNYMMDDIILMTAQSMGSECHNYWYKYSSAEKDKDSFFNDIRRKYYNIGNDCYYVTLYDEDIKKPPLNLNLSYDLPLIIEYVPGNPCEYEEDNIMLKVLREYIPIDVNDGWIPFDIEDRKKMYPKAFEELKRYMKIDEN